MEKYDDKVSKNSVMDNIGLINLIYIKWINK